VAGLLGLLIRAVLRRFLDGIRFDERLARWGVGRGEWSDGQRASILVARGAFWVVLLFGVLVGLTALSPEIASHLTLRLVQFIPDLIIALALIFVGLLLARFLARSVLISAVNLQIASARLLSLGVKWLVLVLTAAMALEHVGIGGQIVRLSFGILFGGIVLALALAVGLGSKDVVSRSWERQQSKGKEEEESYPRRFDPI